MGFLQINITQWGVTQWGTIASLVSGIAAAVAAFLSYKTVAAQNNSLNYATNLAALNDFIIKSYVERIPINYSKNTNKIFIEDRQKLREEFIDSPSEWRKGCLTEFSFDKQTTENEISHSLQNIGLAVFTGILPLKILLANSADGLVLDWLLIKHGIDEHRAIEKIASKQNNNVYFKRRHGEWIALVAFLWLQKNWHYEREWNGALTQILSKDYYGSIDEIEKIIRAIIDADCELFSEQTKDDLQSILNLRT